MIFDLHKQGLPVQCNTNFHASRIKQALTDEVVDSQGGKAVKQLPLRRLQFIGLAEEVDQSDGPVQAFLGALVQLINNALLYLNSTDAQPVTDKAESLKRPCRLRLCPDDWK